MTINLDTPNGIEANALGYQDMLENLQANILKSHSRSHVKLLFLQFDGDEDELKKWIKTLSITSARDQLIASNIRKDDPTHDGGTVMNFFLTAGGYEDLGFNPNKLGKKGNKFFRRGMKHSKTRRALSDPPTSDWEPSYDEEIDAVILLADDDLTRLMQRTAELKVAFAEIVDLITEETGESLKEEIGDGIKREIEHFGYADGISNPRFFKGDIEKDIINSGGDDKFSSAQPLDIVLVKDPFTSEADNNFGSFLVFRKLEQDVDGFNESVKELSENMTLNANQRANDVTEEDLAGALAVGRFKDGTPIVLSDSPELTVSAPNNFEYKDTDQKGFKCPFHAHIRKSNPRGQGLLIPERYIVRRAIPYGKQGDPNPKGLLFMCFQSNLRKQFNFIQKTWANKPDFPPFRGKPGIDPITGQGDTEKQKWPKSYGSGITEEFHLGGFVSMKGGEYFFAPSIGFLKSII